jgi:hypothetical protein
MAGSGKMWTWSSWLRPLAQFFVPEIMAVKRYRKATTKMLKPVIKQRLAAVQNPAFERPKDMVQWLIESSGSKSSSLEFHTTQHLVLNIAAIHTTSGQVRIFSKKISSS